MNQLFFWQEWRKDFRFTYWLLLVLLVSAIVFAGVYYYLGIESTVEWQTLGNLEKVRLNVDTFTQGMFDFTTEADTYLLIEQFNGSDIILHYGAAAFFLSIVIISILILITSASFLKSFWFYGITGIFLFMIGCFHLDIFEVMPKNYFMIVTVISYGGLAIYLNGWGEQFSFFKRLLAFALLTLAVGLAIAKFGVLQHPVLALVNYGILAPMLIFCIFILIIAFDVIYFFLYLTTFTKSADKNNTLNFAAISSLYLGNVLLLYLKKNNNIDWDIVYLNDIILLVTSSILGFWGYKMRNMSNPTNLPFHPYGAFMYIAMAIISFAFMGYIHCIGNDPMMNVAENIIIVSHLCIGGIFFLYVLTNFASYIKTSRPVYEVVMLAGKSPVLTTRLAGLVAIATLLGLKDYRVMYHTFSGYYNGLGDVYKAENDISLSKQYYKQAKSYDWVNFRSNYALGNISQNQERFDEAKEYYEYASFRLKTPLAYATWSNLYLQQKEILQAMPIIKAGLEQFPNSGELHNNLAFAFSLTNVNDSTFHYIKLSEEHLSNPKIAQANKLGFIAKKGLYNLLDKETLKEPSDCLPLENNRLVVLQLTGQKANRGPILKEVSSDSILSNNRFAYYFNYHLSDITQADTSFNKEIDQLLLRNGNIMYSYDLRFLKAYKNYYAIDRKLGYETLSILANDDNYGASFYNNTLGLWLMQNKAWSLATDYLKKGREQHNSSAGVNLAISYLKTPWQKEAISEWEFLLLDKESKELANSMLNLLTNSSLDKILTANDALKLEYLDLYGQKHTEAELGQIYNSIQNKDARIRGGLIIAEDFLTKNDLSASIQMFRTLDGLKPFGNTDFDNEYVRLEWELLDGQRNYTALAESLNDHQSNTKLKGSQQYFYAKYAISKNETSSALQYLLSAQKVAPFDAKISMLLSDLYYSMDKPDKAYETIIQAHWLNAYDIDVIKKYAIICKKMNLDSYSEAALKALKDLTSPAEYNAFVAGM